MGTLKEALTIERSRLFVGRESELAYMRQWFSQKDAPTEVVFVSGMGGIGKSALLLQFLNMAQEEHMLGIWLDGRVCTETPAGFLDSLHSFLFQNTRLLSAPKASMPDIAAALSRQRTLLCIDNYEQLHQIEGWLREVFLPQLPDAGLLLVLAARQDLAVVWQNDLAWRTRVRQMRLAPVSRAEAQEFYTNIGLGENHEIEQLIYDTKGLPLAMALSAERVKLTKSVTEISAWPISMLVSAELLREVAKSDLQEILDLLCILPQANPELFKRLPGGSLTARQLHQLSQLSFVRPTVGGFALHDVARAHLLKDFLHREPERYQTLRLQIVEEMSKELKKAAVDDKKRIAADLLSICRDSFLLGSISIFSMNPLSLTMDSYRNEDLPHLHRLLTEQGELAISLESVEKAHELLDALADKFPESIRVFRSANSIPLTFIAGLLLYRETFAFLEPFIPGVLDACFPFEADQLKQLRLEEADTYYQLLGAATSCDPNYSFLELNGVLLTDHLSRISAAGLRSVLVTKLQESYELFRNLGCRIEPLPGLPEDHPSHGADVYELDLRSSNIGEYVLAFLNGTALDAQACVNAELTENDLKAALSLLADAAALGRSELARKLNCSGADVQQKLQSIFSCDPPPYPLNSRKQALLQLIGEEPALSAEAAAARLHISRATYYRYRSEATADLTEILSR